MKIKLWFAALMASVMSLLSVPAFAQASPFTALTAAVTYVDVIAAIMAVAAIIAALYVAMRGVTLILGFIRRG